MHIKIYIFPLRECDLESTVPFQNIAIPQAEREKERKKEKEKERKKERMKEKKKSSLQI